MHADLDLLCISVYCTADELLPRRLCNARRRLSDCWLRAAERSTVMPFDLSRNWWPDCVPAGTVTRARLPSTVGTSIVPPSAAVVIGIGTRQ